MSDRMALFTRISDYLFASYRWGCMNSPGALAPKPLGLSIDLLEYQRLNQPAYGAYCEIYGRTERGTSILDYPPIPVECFKCADMASFPKETSIAEFHSAEDADGRKAIHRFCDKGMPQRSQIYAFTLMIARIMQPTTRVFSMLPSSYDDIHAQESFMVTSFVETLGSADSGHFTDLEQLITAIEKASEDKVPVHLMGTPEQYHALLDVMGERTVTSDSWSCAMLVGAALHDRKSLAELKDRLAQKLGFNRGNIYGEFGMCELSSQGYEICALNCPGDAPEEGLYIFPNWVKCMVFNPETMAPLLPGNRGRIAIFDLCNMDSAAFVLTECEGELVTLPEPLRSRVQGHPKYALKFHGRASETIPECCRAQWKTWAGRIARQ